MTRYILAVLLAVLSTPATAQANPSDEIVQALLSRGYRIILQERTWLGRERVVAETSTRRRELVFNPETGEIMRDFVVSIDDSDNDGPATTGAVTSGDVAITAGDNGAPKLGIAGDEKTVVDEPVAPVLSPSE